jgi:predicted esterase YcpF (UPF0227 family)
MKIIYLHGFRSSPQSAKAQMLAQYPSAQVKLLEHSDHGLSDFVDHVNEVIQFCLGGLFQVYSPAS